MHQTQYLTIRSRTLIEELHVEDKDERTSREINALIRSAGESVNLLINDNPLKARRQLAELATIAMMLIVESGGSVEKEMLVTKSTSPKKIGIGDSRLSDARTSAA